MTVLGLGLATVLILALMGGAGWLVMELITLRGSVTEVEKRLTAQEVQLDHYREEQDKLAHEWRDIFGAQQSAWGAHVEKITQEVTVQLALGSNTRRSGRR